MMLWWLTDTYTKTYKATHIHKIHTDMQIHTHTHKHTHTYRETDMQSDTHTEMGPGLHGSRVWSVWPSDRGNTLWRSSSSNTREHSRHSTPTTLAHSLSLSLHLPFSMAIYLTLWHYTPFSILCKAPPFLPLSFFLSFFLPLPLFYSSLRLCENSRFPFENLVGKRRD